MANQTYPVTTAADTSSADTGTLEYALTNAKDGDTVQFQAADAYTLPHDFALPAGTLTLDLLGNGAANPTTAVSIGGVGSGILTDPVGGKASLVVVDSAISQYSAGVLTLSSANTYTGSTTVGGTGSTAVTLQGGVADAFGTNSAVSLFGRTTGNTFGIPATLDLGGFDQHIGSLADAAGSTVADETVTNSGTTAKTLHTGADNTSTTFSGFIENGSTTATTALDKTGTGTFTLLGTNSYTGGTTLNGGTLELGALKAAGSTQTNNQTAGGVAFAARGTTLQIDNAALTPPTATPPTFSTTQGSYAAPVTNFATGETLDLSGLTYVPGSTTASLSGTTLTVTNGTLTDTVTNFTLGQGLTPGLYTFATAQDANTTTGTDVTVSLNAPSVPALAPGQDTGTSSTDGLTDISSPRFIGTGADPNSTITLYDGTGTTAIGTGTSDANGNYTATPTAPLADGPHSIAATVTDAYGNVSTRSTATNIIVDTQAPSITALAESGPGIDADGNGDLGAGTTVTLTVTTSEPVYISGGTPTLTLSDGGTATYTGGSGTNRQTFSTTVAAGQNAARLAVTAVNGDGAAVTDAAGNPLNPSLTGAAAPSGTLVVDTTPPTASSVAATAAQGAGATPIGLAAPSDNLTPAGNLAIAAGALPTDGLVTLANGTPVVSGRALTAAQLTGLLFTPAGTAGQTSAFTYTVTDGAGNAAQGTATLAVGAPNSTPITTPNPTPVPDAISVVQQVGYDGSAFAITGTVSAATGVRSVEITAVVNGGAVQDLGAATVAADGTFTFSDVIGADLQAFITATLTDGAGGTASAQADYSLQGGLDRPNAGRAPFVAEQDVYNADGSATTSVSLFRGDGSPANDASRRTTIMAPGQTFTSDQFDDFKNHGSPETTFVFNSNHGLDTISLFRPDNVDHDTLSFSGADFGNSIAEVLNNTRQTAGGSSIITDPITTDTVKLVGITKQTLTTYAQQDITFHA